MQLLLLPLAIGALHQSVQGQSSANSAPVGFVTVNVNAASDGVLSMPLRRPAALAAQITAVSGNTLSVSASMVANQFVYNASSQHNTYYLLITSPSTTGPSFEGQWFAVTSNTTGSITVDSATAQTLQAQNLGAGATMEIIPFWTLNTLLPNGQGIDATTNVDLPKGRVLLTNQVSAGTNLPPNRAYLYYSGVDGPQGWYDISNLDLGLQNDIALLPDSYIVIRNTGAAKTITVTGSVPTADSATQVGLVTNGVAQDNFLINPFPIPMSLNELKLKETGAVVPSTDVDAPKDLVLVFNDNATGFNTPPSKAYLYYNGGLGPEGWYDISNLEAGVIGAQKIIQPGRGFIVRKAKTSTNPANWVATPTY